ncbi:MAG TPA: CAP domain-containing protein, partial [Acidobacteria bacterium]|nr:CAP domain-containing protein [Acidobacteriota bacterium]
MRRGVVALLVLIVTAFGPAAAGPPHDLVELHMSTPAAPDYTTEDRGLRGPVAAAIRRAFPGLEVSHRLSRAAAAYARLLETPDASQPPQAGIDFILHWAGCPDATASSTVLYTTGDGAGEVVDALRKLAGRLGEERPTAVGVARVPATVEPYRWRWGIFLVTRRFRLRRFPSSGTPGATIPLQLRLDPGLADPEVVLLRPSGRIETVPVASAGSWSIASIPLGTERGTLWVELVATARSGPMVVALFPVTVGGSPPVAWSGPPPPDERSIRTAADAERLMVRLINADRERFGLPPLAPDPRLAAIAREHSRDMAIHGYFGHVSPTEGGLARRLAEGHYAMRYSGENISRADSIYEAEEALMMSPGHRANILATEPTVVGVGIVAAGSGERREWVITQLFARPLERIDAERFRRKVRRLLERAARKAGVAPPGRDAKLDAVVESVTRAAAASGASTGEIVRRIAGRLREQGIVY